MGGIFDSDPLRNPWAGAHMVYGAQLGSASVLILTPISAVGYCSSDAWVGNAEPSSNPMGWSFKGAY